MFTPQFLLVGLAILILSVGLPALIVHKKYTEALKEIISDKNSVRLIGFMSLIISAFFLSVQWKFTKNWVIIIPIIGWISLAKGLMTLWFPNLAKTMVKELILKSEVINALIAVLMVLLGIGLMYVAIEIIPTIGEFAAA